MTDTFSADTENLQEFVDHGATYLSSLFEVQTGTVLVRQEAVATLGGGPDDLSSALFNELIGEAARNNNFVERIRRVLDMFEHAPAWLIRSMLGSISLDTDDLTGTEDLSLALEAAWASDDEELAASLLLLLAIAEGQISAEDGEQLEGLAPEVISGVLTGQIDIEDAETAGLPTEELSIIQDRLGDDWRGVTEGDLNKVRDVLAEAEGWEVDWILRQLSNNEIETLIAEVESSGFWSDDWSEETRKEFFVMIGEKVSYRSWMTLGDHTERINPDPATALPDTADPDAEDEALYDRLEYVMFDGPIAEGDPTYPGNVYAPDNPYGLDDMKQGSIGDCYFIAAMIALADQDPGSLRDLISANPNGSFTVTFPDGSQQVVTSDFPVDPNRTSGRPAFARPGPGAQGDELWFMILEKAYAQQNEGWGSIVGGSQSAAIEDLTGRPSNWIDNDDIDIENLATRFENGEILGLSTIDRPDDVTDTQWLADPDTPDTFKPTPLPGSGGSVPARLYQNHAFVVVGVDGENGTISVINPWYPDMEPVVLTEAELIESVNGVRQNDAES